MNLDGLLAELDGPRPLSTHVYAGLESALIRRDHGNPDGSGDVGLRHLDVPRPMSPRARASVEAALVVARSPAVRFPRALLAVAASLALVAGIAVVAQDPMSARAPKAPIASGPAASPAPILEEPGRINLLGPSRDLAPSSPGGTALGPADSVGPVPPRDPVRVGIIRGDRAQEAGFRGFVERHNAGGTGPAIELVDPEDPQTVATVNLSGTAVSGTDGPPPGTRGPLLETLATPEEVLHGRVFSMASPAERQARLLAHRVFPVDAPSATAVVYRGRDGIYAERIPRALREALEARRVNVLELEYTGGESVPLVGAEAVFLSLDQRDTLTFLGYARERGYSPGRTIACIFTMLDEAIVGELRDGYLVMSPYSFGSSEDLLLLEAASQRPVSTASIHGWVTAQALIRALRDGGEITVALSAMDGFDHGFAPPYATRPGSNARIPDGILYEVRDGSFVARGGFASDGSR